MDQFNLEGAYHTWAEAFRGVVLDIGLGASDCALECKEGCMTYPTRSLNFEQGITTHN